MWGDQGPVPGVVAVFSTHLARGRAAATEAFTVDDAYVDVGASSAAEVRALGIHMVNAVALAKSSLAYGDSLLAGSEAGQRGSCAAMARAVMNRPDVRGTVVVAFVTESRIRHRGLLTVANRHGPFTETILLDYPALRTLPDRLGNVERQDLPTRYAGWPVATIDLRDVTRLVGSLPGGVVGGL